MYLQALTSVRWQKKRITQKNVRQRPASRGLTAGECQLHNATWWPLPFEFAIYRSDRKFNYETQQSRCSIAMNPAYQLSIHEIGLDPCIAHIWSPNQLNIYNLYCKQDYSTLIIDASGKLVKRIHVALPYIFVRWRHYNIFRRLNSSFLNVVRETQHKWHRLLNDVVDKGRSTYTFWDSIWRLSCSHKSATYV